MLLKVAGWSSVKTIAGVEPWYIGAIFGLFLLGATTTKDFADMDGDRRGGCRQAVAPLRIEGDVHRDDHRVLTALPELRAGVTVGHDLFRQPGMGHDRKPEVDEIAR